MRVHEARQGIEIGGAHLLQLAELKDALHHGSAGRQPFQRLLARGGPLILAVTDLSITANTYLKWMLVMCSYYMVGKSVNGTTIAGIFCAGGDSKFGFLCDTVTMWCITVPLGLLTAFMLKLPVLAVYFIVNLDEIVKLPAVYRHYKKYKWVKDLTVYDGAE